MFNIGSQISSKRSERTWSLTEMSSRLSPLFWTATYSVSRWRCRQTSFRSFWRCMQASAIENLFASFSSYLCESSGYSATTEAQDCMKPSFCKQVRIYMFHGRIFGGEWAAVESWFRLHKAWFLMRLIEKLTTDVGSHRQPKVQVVVTLQPFHCIIQVGWVRLQ